jgi:hypothetical protein
VIDEQTIRDYCNNKEKYINAAMKGEGTSLGYIQFNHNKK